MKPGSHQEQNKSQAQDGSRRAQTQGTDLPACPLPLASLFSPGLQGPGCLPQASSAWEHSWEAWGTGTSLL